MKIKADFIKQGKPVLAGRLYKICSNKTVEFLEADTNDKVSIHFYLNGSQYGIYGNEYKPPFVEDRGGKKADLLVFVIDEEQGRSVSWVLDVKKTVGGEDVIYHLVEQLTESIKHKNAIALYLDCAEKQHVGYMTREVQTDRIQHTILKKKNEIEKAKQEIQYMPTLIRTKVEMRLLKEEAKLKVLTDFQNNRMLAGGKYIPLEYYPMARQGDTFCCELHVSCR